ncbi:MAG: hypothetical protein JNJ77_04130 [Planctomycetia bacterium]|nr:hypothetical protein [Planctomycetia bacterium]
MPTKVDRVFGIKQKLNRAQTHLEELIVVVEKFMNENEDPYVIEEDIATGAMQYKVKFKTPIPEILPVLIGDVIHNLRCALDHLIWQLVESNGQIPHNRTSFVVCKIKNSYDSAKSNALRGLSNEVLDLFESIQPYNSNSGIQQLTILDDLDNYDKHRKLVVGAVQMLKVVISSMKLYPIDQLPKEEKDPISLDLGLSASSKNGSRILKEGDVVATFPKGREYKNQFGFTLRVAFDEPEFVRNELVRLLLLDLFETVESIIKRFEPYLTSS